ncbi:ras guanine nucleotide exchange factor domain-containing protein [Amylocystis lapponica]|nr:ras guanine nucleotide exchange factor domain-containing protein [Amylocystis lapponica]
MTQSPGRIPVVSSFSKIATPSSIDGSRYSAVFNDDEPYSDTDSVVAPSVYDSVQPREWDIDIDLFAIFSGYKKVHASLCDGSPQSNYEPVKTFLRPLDHALESIEGAPVDIRATSVYDAARRNVLFSRELLESHYDKIRPNLDEMDLNDFLLTGYQLLEMTLNNFRNLLQVIETERSYMQSFPRLSTTSDSAAISNSALSGSDPSGVTPGPLPNTPKKARKLSFLQRLRVSSLLCHGSVQHESPVARFPESSILTGPSVDGDGGKYNIRASLALFPEASHSLSLLAISVRENENEVIRGKDGSITAATLPALVRIFTDQREVLVNDLTDTIDAFFLFFRSFVPSAAFYDMLVARYSERPPPNLSEEESSAWRLYHRLAKMHVAKLLSLWLESHWRHDTDGDILDKIVSFTYGTMAKDKDVPPETSKLVACNLFDRSAGRVSHYGQWLEREAKRGEDEVEAPSPTVFAPRLQHLETLRPDELSVVDVGYFRKPGGAAELARQLTIIEGEFFHAFFPEDLIRFSDPELQKKLEAWKTFSNALTLWVPNCILDHQEAKFRAELVELFIDVADVCMNMRNYSSALAIMLGLQSSSVTRLRYTEEAVGSHYRDLRSQLADFFDSRSNWRAYRAELPQNKPAVPLEVVIFKDVKQSREALPRAPSVVRPPSHATEDFIYLQYCRNLRRTVRDLEKCYGSYKLERVEFMQSWLKHNMDKLAGEKYEDRAQVLNEKSLQVEPRAVKPKSSTLRLAAR